jgi:hypothetical protein
MAPRCRERAPSTTSIWFRRKSVTVGDESVVVLVPAELQKKVTVSEGDHIASIERATPKDGEWHKFNTIVSLMPEDEAQAFGTSQNRAHHLDLAFFGGEEAFVDGGKLQRRNRGGNIGWEARFAPFAPENEQKEQARH